MNRRLARLRRLSSERAVCSSAESRDFTISCFLSETSSVVCGEVLDATSDPVLYALYAEWARAVINGESEEDRRSRLISAITLFPRTELKRAEEPSNIVHLYG